MFPLATTFSTSVVNKPLPRLIVLNPASCDAVIVTVSLPLLPVSVSMPETVPSEKSTVVAFVSTIWSRVPLAVLAPPVDRLAGNELAIGDVDRVVAAAGDDRIGPAAAVERVTAAVLKLSYGAAGESGQGSRRRVGSVVAVRPVERRHHAGVGGHAFGRERRATCANAAVECPRSALRRCADETACGRNASARPFGKRIGEGSATFASAGLAGPDGQGAFRSKCCAEALQPRGFAFDRLGAKRPRRETHFARLAMRDHVDRAQVRPTLQYPGHLRDRRLDPRKHDCLDIWPETRQQRFEIRDGGVDKGDLVRVGHDCSRASWFY